MTYSTIAERRSSSGVASTLRPDGPSAEGFLMYFRVRLAESRFAEEAARARELLV